MLGSADNCIDEIKQQVTDEMLPYFENAAKLLVEKYSGSYEKALCATLAHITGFNEKPKSRSLLNGSDGMITMIFHSGKEIQSYSYVSFVFGIDFLLLIFKSAC